MARNVLNFSDLGVKWRIAEVPDACDVEYFLAERDFLGVRMALHSLYYGISPSPSIPSAQDIEPIAEISA